MNKQLVFLFICTLGIFVICHLLILLNCPWLKPSDTLISLILTSNQYKYSMYDLNPADSISAKKTFQESFFSQTFPLGDWSV